jgi:succinoglycan biosynthesis transport protein ExoP
MSDQMLQPSNTQPEIKRDQATTEMLSSADLIQLLVGFVRRQFTVIVFATLLMSTLGIIYVVTARPSFTAEAQLLIDAHKLQIFQQQSILGDLPVDVAQVESQVEILRSENIAAAVVKNLHLTEDPEFVGSDGGLLGAVMGFVSNPLGFVFSSFESEHIPSEFELNRRAINNFKGRLSVQRVGLSYVINIGFRSFDPERAAQIANAVADAYIVDQLEAKYHATRRAGAWLQDRIKELRDQVSSAERAVVDFKAKNNIVSTGGSDRPLLSQQQVAELSSQLVIARAHTAEAKARLDRINSVLKTDAPTESFGATVTDTLKNEVVSKLRSQYLEMAARESDWALRYGPNHLAVINLRNQMREIRNSIFDELKRLGETYKSDYAIAKQREEGVQRELTQAVAKSQDTDSAQVTLRELQSTAQTYKTLYDNFLQRYMESVQQQSFPITEARLISPASRPLWKSHPRSRLVLGVAALAGMALGFGLGLFRDLSDRVFRTSEQVNDLLDADCIALLPLLSPGKMSREKDNIELHKDSRSGNSGARNRKTFSNIARLLFLRASGAVRSTALVSDLHGSIKSTREKLNTFTSSLVNDGNPMPAQSRATSGKESKSPGPRTIVRNDSVFWTVVDDPLSRYTEAVRSMKLAADLSGAIKTSRVIGLTSSLPNEGKSTVSAAFAELISQAGGRTILIDCDLRNPSLSRALTPNAGSGLLEVITGKDVIEDVVWTEPSTNLTFLPVVVRSRLANSSEIIGSEPVRKLFEQLREKYDYIVVDLPPLAPIIDVQATAHLIDSFIFVIEWGRTKIDIVEHALKRARSVRENMLGVVLNKVDMNVFGRYASHQESYYYNKHYARYGYTE